MVSRTPTALELDYYFIITSGHHNLLQKRIIFLMQYNAVVYWEAHCVHVERLTEIS